MIRAAHFVEFGDGCNDVHEEEDEVEKVPSETHLRVQAKDNVSVNRPTKHHLGCSHHILWPLSVLVMTEVVPGDQCAHGVPVGVC